MSEEVTAGVRTRTVAPRRRKENPLGIAYLRCRPRKRKERPRFRLHGTGANVIPANIPFIAPDDGGGWYAIQGSHGWLFGSRTEALIAARALAGR